MNEQEEFKTWVIEAPNYTQVYNGFLDRTKELKEGELRVALCVFRYTKGFQRESHYLSIEFIQQYTGMAKKAVINSIKTLIEKGIILRVGVKDGVYIYKLNMQPEQGVLKTPSNVSLEHVDSDNQCVQKIPKKERSTLKKKDNKETSSSNPIEEQKQEPKKPYVVLNEYALQTVGLMMNSNDCRLATDDIEAYTLEGMMEAVDIAKAQGKGGINYKYIATIAKNQHAKKMSDLEAKNKQRAKNEAMVLKINPVAPVAPVNDDELDNLFS